MAVTQTRKLAPFEQFMAYRRFSAGLAFSPDAESVYFVSNISGQFNLWRVAVDGGWPQQLTAFTDDTIRLIGISPGDGWPEKITDDPQVQHYVGGDAVSPDGTKLAYAANARTPTDMEVWVRDLDSGDVRPVFGDGKYTFPGAWSPDGTKLIG